MKYKLDQLGQLALVGLVLRNNDLCKNAFTLYLSFISSYGLIRKNDYYKICEFLFLYYLQLKDYANCRKINTIIQKRSEMNGQHYWQNMFLVNQALIYASQNNYQEAKSIVSGFWLQPCRRQNTDPHDGGSREYDFPGVITSTNTFYLSYIAKLEGNIEEYSKYSNDLAYYKSDYYDDKALINELLIKKNRDIIENNLKENNTQNTIRDIVIGIAIIAVILTISSLVYRQQQTQKKLVISNAANEKSKSESEKASLELETLRLPYLKHAIGNQFIRIRSLIRNGINYSDPNKFNIAIDVIGRVDDVFSDIIKYSSKKITLIEEIENGRKCVDLLTGGDEKPVEYRTDIDPVIGEKIFIPSFSLSDFYINAVNRGELRIRQRPYILTRLETTDTDGLYLLTIENNGISMEEAAKKLHWKHGKKHVSTGHNRVARRFELFNLDNNDYKLFFDKASGFQNITNPNGEVIGVKIIIKIVFNDFSKHTNS